MEVMSSGAAAAPSENARHQFRFDGSGGEYFKIWIVNLALTIVTLGIFSAWAKVRNKRYFYGNTFIAGHNFEYHGNPVRILIGRLIALGLLLAYYITASLMPMAGLIWLLIFLVAAPWLIVSSLRFNARNTSYRNIRFDFHGGYGGAFKVMVLWPLLAVITLFTTQPLAHRAQVHYQINNHNFGGKQFHAELPVGKLYLIYMAGLAIVAVGVAVIAALFIHMGLSLESFAPDADGRPPQPTPGMMAAFFTISVAYLGTFLLMAAVVGTLSFNLALNHTRLGEALGLEADLSPFAMCWIMFSNLFLLLVTLGFFSPWAHVRLTRYMLAHVAANGPAAMDGFVASAAPAGSAVGEEVAGFFDFDFSL